MANEHIHLLVDCTLNNPPKSEAVITDWLTRLVKAVDMNIFMEPRARYCDTPGNEGITGDVVIDTSHSSLHIWDGIEQPFGKFDLYSCKDFKIDTYLKLVEEFEPVDLIYMLIDRSNGYKILDTGTRHYEKNRTNTLHAN